MSIANISKFGTEMKENEEILNTNIDTNIDEFKAGAYRSINNTLSPISSNNSPSYYNQPSDGIIKWPILKSPDFHSCASQFTKFIQISSL